MLSYRPGRTPAHRLDPRTKLGIQVAFAIAAATHTDPAGLLVLGAVAGGILLGSGTDPVAALRRYRLAVVLLVLAPALQGATLGPPWFDVGAAGATALASVRVGLILLVGAAYVETTPVRESQAAIGWLVPGRPGRVLATGVGFVARFLPAVLGDLDRQRTAMRARLGERRPLAERMAMLALGGADRAIARADRFAEALRARCFAWNPTLPELRFGRPDVPGLLLLVALVGYAAIGLLT